MQDTVNLNVVEQCKQQDREAQYALFAYYKDAMFTSLYRLLACEKAAHEVLRSGFVKVFQQIVDYQSDSSLQHWIKSIIITEAINRLAHKFVMDIPNSKVFISNNDIDDEISGKRVEKMILALDDTSRCCFLLRKVERYSFREVAEWLNTTEQICMRLCKHTEMRIIKQLNEEEKAETSNKSANERLTTLTEKIQPQKAKIKK